jgi:hypothetical protein
MSTGWQHIHADGRSFTHPHGFTCSEPVVVPPEVILTWCPVCGRNDRYQSLGSSYHWSGGEKCPGVPIRLTYKPEPSPIG